MGHFTSTHIRTQQCFFDLATGDFANTEYTVAEYEALSRCGKAIAADVPHGYKVSKRQVLILIPGLIDSMAMPVNPVF